MPSTPQQELLRQLPSVNDLLHTSEAQAWLADHPRALVTDCIRQAVETLRRQVLSDQAGRCGAQHVQEHAVLARAGQNLADATQPRLRGAINATGIILHTGLGRAVWPSPVVDSMIEELKGYVTLAIDREQGQRINRDQMVEPLLCELTGAEAATVANNNAAATMLVLAAIGAGREVIVSRGQLIEIGGSFRLPDVMQLSGAKLVEVGTTNRTHLRDYASAITENTAAIMRVHPSNYRIVGFHGEVPLDELVKLGRERGIPVIDDLGAGAMVDLEQFGLPHEPTVHESIATGADIALFSADKLIGASQGGIIVGRTELVKRIRRHPLARAMRVDKTCLMALERTLMLFRDIGKLRKDHPLYQMLSLDDEQLERRARALAAMIAEQVDSQAGLEVRIEQVEEYLGSGSVPMQPLRGSAVRLAGGPCDAGELARRLRLDDACVYCRVAGEAVMLHVRTVSEAQLPTMAAAVGRVAR
jgi:L-seryl-tRNA(Ser) seleniumtransferase